MRFVTEEGARVTHFLSRDDDEDDDDDVTASVNGSRPRGICAGTSQITHQAVNEKETDTLLPCSSEVLI